MRANFFQYHVQDRIYNKAEVLSLINNESYKHHLLSNNAHFYSMGATGETIQFVTSIPYKVASTIASLVNRTPAEVQNNNHNSTNTTKINIFDKPADNNQYYEFTGREVAAFLNKYYDYGYVLSFHSKVQYDNFINQFLEHKYVDAEVPTLGNSSIFDVAVLDVY